MLLLRSTNKRLFLIYDSSIYRNYFYHGWSSGFYFWTFLLCSFITQIDWKADKENVILFFLFCFQNIIFFASNQNKKRKNISSTQSKSNINANELNRGFSCYFKLFFFLLLFPFIYLFIERFNETKAKQKFPENSIRFSLVERFQFWIFPINIFIKAKAKTQYMI